MDWDKLKIFHAVTQAGSFTKAGEVLNLSQSAISRQIQSLEYELKCSLFQRHARGLSLTENGETLYKTANEVISKIKEVETDLVERKDKPSGKLVVLPSLLPDWLLVLVALFLVLPLLAAALAGEGDPASGGTGISFIPSIFLT